eukprot:GSMAST32.ASY1.ANO1.273.1 assembled CDS
MFSLLSFSNRISSRFLRGRCAHLSGLVEGIVIQQDEFKEIRQGLHREPELGFEEYNTASLVASKLKSWGIEVTSGIGRTGVVGTLRLRADMDALPISEETGTSYISSNPGVHHACGHDGHTTMLLGAAKYLAETRNFRGTVNFIFQPNEEDGSGAPLMLKDNLFDRFPCDQIYGIHNWPTLPFGHVGIKSGPLMGSEDNFIVSVSGESSHAAIPNLAVDPLISACHIVTALQTIVSRNADPDDGAVLSVTQFNAPALDSSDGSFNIIPDRVEFRGTIRCFKPETRNLLIQRMKDISKGISDSFGTNVKIKVLNGNPATINDKESSINACKVATSVVGAKQVISPTPTSASEDFAFMLNERPGCYIWIATTLFECPSFSKKKPSYPLHHPKYDFNDNIIPIGSSIFVRLVETLQTL